MTDLETLGGIVVAILAAVALFGAAWVAGKFLADSKGGPRAR